MIKPFQQQSLVYNKFSKQFYSMKNPQVYLNHQLNNSTSKAAHVFPKERRFNERKRFITESFYELPSTRNNRFTSFGYGQKSSLLNKSQSPPPGAYQYESEFRKDKGGITIGKGRQTVSFASFLGEAKSKKYLPSPNKYTVVVPMSKISGKIFGKLPNELDSVSKKQSPGPASYNYHNSDLKNSGSYILSTVKNYSSPRLHTQGSQSVDKHQRKLRQLSNLGPTSYDTLEKQMGVSFNSKHKSIQARTFSKGKREGLVQKNKINFPGAKYKRFSEFGTYV